MTVIRVNPESVRAYGADAQSRFEAIRAELEALVRAVTEVRYFGPNAVDFKTRSGQMAADFANKLTQDMGAIAEAVRTSTTNIAASLGGAPVVINVAGGTIAPPAVESVDFVDVDTSALENLKGVIDRHFSVILDNFDQHLQRLQSTDWQGNAREQALGQVQGFTASAKTRTTEAQASLNQYVTSQLQSVTTADR